MPQDEKWFDKYVVETGSKQHAAQKAGALAGAGGGLLAAIALATGPVGLALLIIGGAAAGTAAAAEAVPGKCSE
jgi:hypothetical protein